MSISKKSQEQLNKHFILFDFDEVASLLDQLPRQEQAFLLKTRKWGNIKKAAINKNTRGPDFLVIGAQKGGTSSMNRYLRQHPDVCTPFLVKELHYFEVSDKVDISRYHQCFSPDENTQVIGESTPTYMYFPEIPERIAAYNKNMKLIALLRDPIGRLFSQWNMVQNIRANNGHSIESFDIEAVVHEHQQHLQTSTYSKPGYISRGMYATQLDQISKFFPREQILLINSENFLTNTHHELKKVYQFLGLKPYSTNLTLFNTGKYVQNIPADAYQILKDLFADDSHRLRKDYAFDNSNWFQNPPS